VCERVKANTIECTACKALIHKSCSRVRGAPTRVKDYECGRRKGFHNDEEEVKYIKLGNDMIDIPVVQESCYLGDVVEVVMMFKVNFASQHSRLEYVLAGKDLVSCLKY